MTVVHEVAFNIPLGLHRTRRHLDELALIRQEIWYDYRQLPDLTQTYSDEVRRLDEVPYEVLKARARSYDGPAMLEYALRNLADCDRPAELSIYQILEIVDFVSDDLALLCGRKRPEMYIMDSDLAVRARALRAWIFFQAHFCSRRWGTLLEIRNNPHINNAVHASHCAVMCSDFVPPITIRVAEWLMTLNARYAINIRWTEPFDKFKEIWHQYNQYIAWQDAREKARADKVAKAPNKYRCAAEGCGIQATHRSALRKCGGRCPPERKPHYCSWACQERHWFVHRYFCKPGVVDEHIPDDDGDPDWIDEDECITEAPYTRLPDRRVIAAWPDSEIFVDIPHPSPYRKGHVLRVRTSTFSPDFLRSYRALWEAPDWRRRQIEKIASKQMFGPSWFSWPRFDKPPRINPTEIDLMMIEWERELERKSPIALTNWEMA